MFILWCKLALFDPSEVKDRAGGISQERSGVMLTRSAVGDLGAPWNIRGSLILASEGWKPSPLSLIVWPWAGHPLHVHFLIYFQVKKVILTSQVFSGDKIKKRMPMLCTVLSGMFLLAMRTCTPSCELLNVSIKDFTLGQRVPGCGPGYWSVLSFADIRQTHPWSLYFSIDLLIPRLLKRWSHKLLTLLFKKGKGRKIEGEKNLLFFFLTCGFF